MVDDDARDERVAAWLEPEPLDDVTRRRLVSNAMRQSRDSHARRWIATAAAIVVVLVGALALVTANGGNDDHPTAAPARTPESAKSAPSPQADAAAPAAPTTIPPAVVDLGDFGNLGRAANVARLRNAFDNSQARSSSGLSQSEATTGATADAGASLPCRDRLPAGTVLAIARGTLDARAAVVVVIDRGNGSRVIDAVLSDPCEVRDLS